MNGNGPSCKRPGVCPRFRQILKRCGAHWKDGVRDTRANGRGLNTATAGGEDYRANLSRGVEYVCKGADGEVLLTLGRKHEPGGEIVGKRCGVSRNIDRSARIRLDLERADELKANSDSRSHAFAGCIGKLRLSA